MRAVFLRWVLLFLFGLYMATAGVMESHATDLGTYQWRSRLLIVFTPSEEHLLFQSLEAELRSQQQEVAERDVLVFRVFNRGQSWADRRVLSPEEAAALQRQFSVRPDQFSVILIGKDGGVKLRRDSKIGLAEIFSTIDGMPMRQQEMKEKSKKPQSHNMKETIMAENVCHGEHSGHICVLASEGKFEMIKEITREPKFICFNCGRVADSEKNLCNPMPLK